MAFRIYILPMITVIDAMAPNGSVRRPAYTDNLKFSAVDYGSENVCVCLLHDLTQEQHDSIVSKQDVMSLPQNIDQNMTSGAVNAAQSFLEGLNIPANWINTNRTFRDVVKIIVGLFQLNQKWSGLTNGSSPFKEGLNLETKFVDMTTNVRSRLLLCFDELNIDRTMLTVQNNIREILFEFGKQMKDRVNL
jgi:hypothetical protein